jgi:hypothetical protein
VTLIPSLILSGSGVAVAAVAFAHRGDPAWQRGMATIMGLAIMQVVLGVVTAVLIR